MVRQTGTKHRLGSPTIRVCLAVMLLGLSTDSARCEEVPPIGKDAAAKPPSAKAAFDSSGLPKLEVQRAITDLGSPDFAVRERASRQLWSAGAEAEPALERAARQSDDFEVVHRARQLLLSMQWGINADTPQDLVLLIGQYRLGDVNGKQVALQGLKQKGKADLAKLLIAKEADPDLRAQLNQFYLTDIPFRRYRRFNRGAGGFVPAVRAPDPSEIARQVRVRLVQREFDWAEALLHDASSDASMRDYAALLMGRGKLDAAIVKLRANLKPGDSPDQRRLVWMLRAKGDLAGAVAAAKLVKDDDLRDDLLGEMGDWKELAKINAKADVEALAARQDGAQKLAQIMVFRHLAGEKQGCDLAAAAAMKAWKQRQPRYAFLRGAFLLGDRTDQVIQSSEPHDVSLAFEMLVAQSRINEAFRLVKIDVPIPAKIDWTVWLKGGKQAAMPDRLLLGCQVLRVLHLVGAAEQAHDLTAAIVDTLGKKLPEGVGLEVFALKLMDVEVAAGSPESCDALAAKLFALDLDNPESLISRLYRDQDTIAPLLWRALRGQFPGEDRPAALKHLRRLLTGKPDATAIEDLSRLALRVESQLEEQTSDDSPDDETSDPRARKLLALATLFHRYGQNKFAMKYLARFSARGVSAKSLIDQGNLYAEEKQWTEAARSYEAAWTKSRRSAAALYLWGWAQTKRGEEAEGRKRMELALMVPLADGEIRHELVQTLTALHQDEEAAKQRQSLLRVAAVHDWSIIQVLLETGDAAAEKPDSTGVAAVWQRVAAELVSGAGQLSDPRFYMQFSAAAHAASARELLRAGKTAEAVEELHQAEAVQPGNIQLALDCDAALRKHGAAVEADALYHRMLARHEALCRDFPKSATFHNDLAWLAANLDRDLDKAQAYAQRAVELEPRSAGILDTLAEVDFRRGNRAEAVRLAKRCLEMEPDGEHYKKQLARFEAKTETARQ